MSDKLALYKADWMRALADAGLGAVAISQAIELADLNGLFDPIKTTIHDAETTDRDAYNDGYTHEAMHTAHVLCDTWDNHISETRACDEFPDLKEAAHKAADAMYYFYQLAGQKFSDEPSDAVGAPSK